MTAQDVIEQIKALPPEEKAVVIDFVRDIEAKPSEPSDVRYVDRATLEESAERIFDRYDELFRKLAE